MQIDSMKHTLIHTYASTQFFNQSKGNRCGSGYFNNFKFYYIQDIRYVLHIAYYCDLQILYVYFDFFNVLFEVAMYAGRHF